MNELYVFTYTDLAVLAVVAGSFGYLLGVVTGLIIKAFSRGKK